MTLRTVQKVTAVVLGGLALVTVVMVGARAYAQGPGGPGMHAGMMKRMVSAALDEALDQAAVTAEQRTAIYASRDRAFATLQANRPDRAAHRDRMLTLFEGDRLDTAQLVALHAQVEQSHQAMRDAVAQAVVEIHDTLTPAQRQIVANYVRTHAPHGMR